MNELWRRALWGGACPFAQAFFFFWLACLFSCQKGAASPESLGLTAVPEDRPCARKCCGGVTRGEALFYSLRSFWALLLVCLFSGQKGVACSEASGAHRHVRGQTLYEGVQQWHAQQGSTRLLTLQPQQRHGSLLEPEKVEGEENSEVKMLSSIELAKNNLPLIQ